MSTSVREEILRYVPRTDDPEIRARQRHVAQVLLELDPELRQEVQQQGRDAALLEGRRDGLREGRRDGLREGRRDGLREGRRDGLREGQHDGRLQEARGALRRVLLRRGLTVTAEQDARIEACDDLALLERWLDEAIMAASATDALR